MKALKCKPSAQFAYNYTINVLSKCSNIISHLSSILESPHINHRSSKVDTSIFEGRDQRRKHRTDNPTSHRILFTTVLHKIPRGLRIPVTLGKVHTPLRTYIRQQPHTCSSCVLLKYMYLYYVYALVGGAISFRGSYICAVSRVCANESHSVFHRPVVCAVKT